MKIIFYASDKSRERNLAAAFCFGVMKQRRLGEKSSDTVHIRSNSGPIEPCDLACVFGVKSKALVDKLTAAGIPFLYFDKGYTRHKKDGWCEYTRVALNGHSPSAATLLGWQWDHTRWASLGNTVAPWRTKGTHILLAGSSEKYQRFHGLPDPTFWAKLAVKHIRRFTDRPIVYRPKPSWKGAEKIPGTSFSKGRSLAEDFKDCHTVITHGSNVSYDAALNGVPSVVLGNGVTGHWSTDTTLDDLVCPTIYDRTEMFNALAYHQWTLDEFISGEAFATIRKWL